MRIPMSAGAALLAVALSGCGGGGSSSTARTAADVASVDEEAQVVVELDLDGDDTLDVVTLDTGASPLVILEALLGDDAGDFQDATATLKNTPLDANISQAIELHLANGIRLGEETELQVTDTRNRDLVVTILE